MMKEIFKETKERMTKSIEALKKDLAGIRTGRASLALLDPIRVDYYGSQVPLNQVATLNVPEPRTITIQPWEQRMISVIEKAILESDLGLTPTNDGKVIRINIPPLTEERRKQLTKVVRKRAEEARVAIRNIRRDANDQLKKLQKGKEISEEELNRGLDEIQKITDGFIKQVNDILEKKEKEIMEV